MKKFISENWYKLMIGSSLLMASFGFMVHSVSPAMADVNNQKFNVNSNYKLVSTNADGSINVKLSNEQLNKIIPKNADGSINVKMAPNEVMDINLQQITGQPVGKKTASNGSAVLWVGNYTW
jgi:ABC-type transporter MlaC component